MERVTVTRSFDAPPDDVREAMADVEAFMESSGFDGVERDGDALRLQNRVGLMQIELELEILDDDADLAYEQREGIFESMRTEYRVEGSDEQAGGDGDPGETTVTATTEFEALDLAVIGNVLDTTVIRRQRRKEIESQFDWLAGEVA